MRTVSRITVIAIVMNIASAYAQGPLTPSGAPAPMMKTLDQVEPRTAITNVPFTINTPGSYYLTGNLSGGGITITTNDVTLDLMGFTISSSGSGIAIEGTFAAPLRNIVVRNGGLRDFSTGIDIGSLQNGLFEYLLLRSSSAGTGIKVSSKALSCVFQHLVVDSCNTGFEAVTYGGDYSFTGNTIRDSIINGSNDGIELHDAVSSGNTFNNNIIEHVKITDSYSAIYLGTANPGSMRGNVIRSCTFYSTYGISSSGANGTLVEKNMLVKIPSGLTTVAVDFSEKSTNNLVIANVSIGHDSPAGPYRFGAPDHNTWGPIVTNTGALSSTGDAAHPWANFAQ